MSDLQEIIARGVAGFIGAVETNNELNRGAVQLVEVDLTRSDLLNGIEIPEAVGKALRLLRHGSNPGARLQLAFSGQPADNFWAPGKAMRGGFDGFRVKLAPGSARVGKATFACLKSSLDDFREDLIISAIGPVDLLGSTNANGDPAAYVTVAEDTDPSGANPVGSFDGSGWELLRILVDGNSAAGNFTTSDLVPWMNPYYSGTNWFEQGIDRISIPDSDTSGQRFRVLTVPWGGRGLGYFAVRNLLAAGRTGLGLIVQGLK